MTTTPIVDPKVGQRIAQILFITQSLGSAALISNATVNPIIGVKLSQNEVLAGVPGTLLLIGAALASYPAGELMQRLGRRPGLALGFMIGALGMAIGGYAIVVHSFAIFLLGLLLIGAARGAVDQSRYAAADANLPEARARAISTVVFAGTVGAVGGPLLVAPLGALVERLFGFDVLAGPMIGGSVVFAISGVLIITLLRPPRYRAHHRPGPTQRRRPTTGSSTPMGSHFALAWRATCGFVDADGAGHDGAGHDRHLTAHEPQQSQFDRYFAGHHGPHVGHVRAVVCDGHHR